MKVLMAASEVTPFAQTGGLADVVGLLSGALCAEGVATDIVMPLYASVDRKAHKVRSTGKRIEVDVAGRMVEGALYACPLPGTSEAQGTAYFIEAPCYYDRDTLYGTEEGDYADNCERFIFFSRGVLEAAEVLGLGSDIIHCHDWQTALVPVYLKTLYAGTPVAEQARCLLTVHNLAYQGLFWHWDWPLTGLDWSLFSWRALEFYGKINLLKGGLVFADAISTVSKTYSREMQTPEYGCGLEGVLQSRSRETYGVVNGLDAEVWDPARDDQIVANYSVGDLAGKAQCKQALQYECNLEVNAAVPIVAMVAPLTDRKGFDLVEEAFDAMLRLPIQLVILGMGQRHHGAALEALAAGGEGRVFFKRAYDAAFSHRIFAGSDILLAPSHFEPSGLSQLVALRYGAVPVVRSTGGLADTVEDFTPEGLEAGTANGFAFLEYNAAALLDELERAVGHYGEGENWARLVANGMRQDWSFLASARRYREIYHRMCLD